MIADRHEGHFMGTSRALLYWPAIETALKAGHSKVSDLSKAVGIGVGPMGFYLQALYDLGRVTIARYETIKNRQVAHWVLK